VQPASPGRTVAFYVADFGLMLREAQQGAAGQPMLVVAPGLLLLVIVLALSITSRGLRAQGAVPASGATDAA